MLENMSCVQLSSCVWSSWPDLASNRPLHMCWVPGRSSMEAVSVHDESKRKLNKQIKMNGLILFEQNVQVTVLFTMTVKAPRWYWTDILISPQTFSPGLVIARWSEKRVFFHWLIKLVKQRWSYMDIWFKIWIPLTFATCMSCSCWSRYMGWKKVYTRSEWAISSADSNNDTRKWRISGKRRSATVLMFDRPTCIPLGKLFHRITTTNCLMKLNLLWEIYFKL